MADKKTNQIHITMKSGEMQGRETIVTSATLIQKALKHLLFLLPKLNLVHLLIGCCLTTATHYHSRLISIVLLQDEFNDYFYCLLDILVRGVMDR